MFSFNLTRNLTRKKWTAVNITQKKIKGGKYQFKAQIGEDEIKAINKDPKTFTNVKLFSGCSEWPPAHALTKELKFSSIGKNSSKNKGPNCISISIIFRSKRERNHGITLYKKIKSFTNTMDGHV